MIKVLQHYNQLRVILIATDANLESICVIGDPISGRDDRNIDAGTRAKGIIELVSYSFEVGSLRIKIKLG